MTTAHPEAAGWVLLPGGITQAEADFGRPLLRLAKSREAEAATCWPNDTWHTTGMAPPTPLPSVWLSYDHGTKAALRVATVTESSGILYGDAERDTISIATQIGTTDRPEPWSDDAWHDTDTPGQDPIVIDDTEHAATSCWLGPDLVVRAARVEAITVALSGSPNVLKAARLTWGVRARDRDDSL